MNIDRYKKDIQKLYLRGADLLNAMIISERPDEKKKFNKDELKEIPQFRDSYQPWYSESLICLQQLMPSRVDDFISYYKSQRMRKEINYEKYTISDYLQGLRITRGGEEVVSSAAALPKMKQQFHIVESLKSRFDSSLYDIKTLVQADLFDDELDTASELRKHKFLRAAGAVAGVVLESHLKTVCELHGISNPKGAMLGKLNESLKSNNTIDIPTWRFIQHLTDVRNLCDHKLENDPTFEQIGELIDGVRKIMKTVF